MRFARAPVQVSASSRNAHGHARAEAGDTNVVIRLGVGLILLRSRNAQRSRQRQAATRTSLGSSWTATPLPPVNHPALPYSTSSSAPRAGSSKSWRSSLRPPAEGGDGAGLQAAVTTPDFQGWKTLNPSPSPWVFHCTRKAQDQWVSDVEKLPWLILTDADRHVTSEGFTLDELDTKLKGQAKTLTTELNHALHEHANTCLGGRASSRALTPQIAKQFGLAGTLAFPGTGSGTHCHSCLSRCAACLEL